jgi:tRNA (guanine37-N1)-methyltransferase
MYFTVLTIFPEIFAAFQACGMVRKAIAEKQISFTAVDIRDFAAGRHRVSDDRPYGGGCGMVMKPEPLVGALRSIATRHPGATTVHMSPQGRPFDQQTAALLADLEGLTLICGRYEGIDERVCRQWVDLEVSIGDFILTGGELAAMVVIDAVTRLLPGVLGAEESASRESFAGNLLAHEQYTRPEVFEGDAVPPVLLSGHHADIDRWRRESALIRTFLKRPDLLARRSLGAGEIRILEEWQRRMAAILESQGAGRPAPASAALPRSQRGGGD